MATAAAHGVYVYGVVRAGHPAPPRLRGVGGGAPSARLLPAGRRLAAVAGDAPEGLRARRRDLLAHQEMLLALGAAGPVLPMRFGMICRDEDAVRRRLAAAETEHLAVLERVDGRVEMNLKVMPAQDALESLVREDPRVRRLREAARGRPGYEADVRLGEAVVAGLTRRAAEAAAGVREELAAHADGCTPGPDVAGCVLNASFLVAGSRLDAFRAAADALAVRHRERAELRLTGPLPCYSFVDSDPLPEPEPVPHLAGA